MFSLKVNHANFRLYWFLFILNQEYFILAKLIFDLYHSNSSNLIAVLGFLQMDHNYVKSESNYTFFFKY